MSTAELPSSVLYSPNKLGPGTLSRGSEALKVSEENGLRLKRHNEASQRIFHLKSVLEQQPVTSIVYERYEETDMIGLYSEGTQKRQFVKRSEVCIEVGTANNRGLVSAKYDIATGELLCHEFDPEAFPYASFPLESIDKRDISFIDNLCASLKTTTTPNPVDLKHLKEFANAASTTHEPSVQSSLFEH